MLAVGPWLAPVDCRCLAGHRLSVERNVLAIALHRQLLEVSWETLQVLLVRQDGLSLGAEEIVIPDRQKAHEHGKVFFEGSGAEVFVDLVEAAQHRAKIIRTD